MMKVCLANLPWEVEDRWGIRAGCRFPNLMPKKHNSVRPLSLSSRLYGIVPRKQGCPGSSDRRSCRTLQRRELPETPQSISAGPLARRNCYDVDQVRPSGFSAGQSNIRCNSHCSVWIACERAPGRSLGITFCRFCGYGRT